jgi:hypothetical protein
LFSGTFIEPSAWRWDGPVLIVDKSGADRIQAQGIEVNQELVWRLQRIGESHLPVSRRWSIGRKMKMNDTSKCFKVRASHVVAEAEWLCIMPSSGMAAGFLNFIYYSKCILHADHCTTLFKLDKYLPGTLSEFFFTCHLN